MNLNCLKYLILNQAGTEIDGVMLLTDSTSTDF